MEDANRAKRVIALCLNIVAWFVIGFMLVIPDIIFFVAGIVVLVFTLFANLALLVPHRRDRHPLPEHRRMKDVNRAKRVIVMVAFFLLLSMPFVLSPVRALERSIIWQTKADWDSGLKSNVSGHVGLETYTDNQAWKDAPTLRPVSGLFASSAWGDNFRLLNDTAETWKLERPVASDCTDNGAEWISTTDPTFSYTSPSTGNPATMTVDAGDGAMIFMHNGTIANSTRTTTVPVAKGTSWEMGIDMAASIWGISNFSWALTSLSPGDSTGYIYCGGLNSTVNPDLWGVGFRLLKNGLSDVGPGLFALQPFRIEAGIPIDCGSMTRWGAGEIIRPRIWRTGGNLFQFGIAGGAEPEIGPTPLPNMVGSCSFNSTGVEGSFLYSTFAFNSTSGIGGTILIHLYKNMNQGYVSNPSGFGTSVTANWTSPSTNGISNERPIHFRITAFVDGNFTRDGGGSLCTPTIWDANSWVVRFQVVVCTQPFVGYTIWEMDIDPIAQDGPYRFGFSFGGDPDYYSRIDLVELTLEYEPIIPPPVQGEAHPPAILANMTGAIVFCGIGAAILVVFIILVKRVKDS